MGTIKLKDQAAEAITKAEKDQAIIDNHIKGFLSNWDKRATGTAPFVKASNRMAYESGVRDALTWVKKFNEENRPEAI